MQYKLQTELEILSRIEEKKTLKLKMTLNTENTKNSANSETSHCTDSPHNTSKGPEQAERTESKSPPSLRLAYPPPTGGDVTFTLDGSSVIRITTKTQKTYFHKIKSLFCKKTITMLVLLLLIQFKNK